MKKIKITNENRYKQARNHKWFMRYCEAMSVTAILLGASFKLTACHHAPSVVMLPEPAPTPPDYTNDPGVQAEVLADASVAEYPVTECGSGDCAPPSDAGVADLAVAADLAVTADASPTCGAPVLCSLTPTCANGRPCCACIPDSLNGNP